MLTFPGREQNFTRRGQEQPAIFDVVGDVEGHEIASCERDALSHVSLRGPMLQFIYQEKAVVFPVSRDSLVPPRVNCGTTRVSILTRFRTQRQILLEGNAAVRRASMITMQRFNVGDRVAVLHRFAHLHPKDSGVVVEVQLDPFRPIFNEYTVQFSDGSTSNLFEFQLQEVKD
jgi:hypothetical protein